MSNRLRDIAVEIWKAGVAAVDSGHLIRSSVSVVDGHLCVVDQQFELDGLDRIVVVGAGKAGAGMAAAVEEVLTESGCDSRLCGWVNVPEDCVRPLSRIRLHAARPAGVNEPTEAGVIGTGRILELVKGLTDRDLCLVLLSGGGSALLPAPTEGVSLEDKQTVTRLLMHGGATIQELNCVRRHLSRVKGGGLARTAKAGRMVSLIISDVIGDPLDVIASGPTVPDSSTPGQALDVLKRVISQPERIPESVVQVLTDSRTVSSQRERFRIDVTNRIVGSNAVALEAAAEQARRLGYRVELRDEPVTGTASAYGRGLAARVVGLLNGNQRPACLLSGGEPVVQVVETDRPRKGGRNQEVALGACSELRHHAGSDLSQMVVLAAGTDGEDGPTDAAGAVCDADVLSEMRRLNLEPDEFLVINDAYGFFDRTGGLIRTGPTHTNVMDLHVVLVGEAHSDLPVSG